MALSLFVFNTRDAYADARGSYANRDCPQGDVCVWSGSFFSGRRSVYSGDRSYYELRPEDRNEVSSWSNQTETWWCLYDYVDRQLVALDALGPGQARGVLPIGDNQADAIGQC